MSIYYYIEYEIHILLVRFNLKIENISNLAFSMVIIVLLTLRAVKGKFIEKS